MEANRIKSSYVPLMVGFSSGSTVFGLDLASAHWHWPDWVIWIIALPASFTIAFVLSGLLNAATKRFKSRRHNHPKTGDGAV
jgi:hypothetical protein